MRYNDLLSEVANYAISIKQVLFSVPGYFENIKEAWVDPKFAQIRKLFREEADAVLPAKVYRQRQNLFNLIGERFYAEPGFSMWKAPRSEISLDDPQSYKHGSALSIEGSEKTPVEVRMKMILDKKLDDDFSSEEFAAITERRPLIAKIRTIADKLQLQRIHTEKDQPKLQVA